MKMISDFAALLFALIIGLPCQAREVRPAAETEPAHVLVLLSYHHGHSWEDDILHGFEAWNATLSDRPVLHVEWMDTKRYASAEYRQRYQQFLEKKYADRHFDLIATVDDNALIDAVKSIPWRGVPIVFSGINGDPASLVGARGRATGIAERYEVARTLNLALSLKPNTERLIFITAADESGAGNRATIEKSLASLAPMTMSRLTVEHWTPSSLDTIDSRLSGLSERAVVFALGSIPITEGGRPKANEQLVAYVRAKTRGPVYSDTDRSVGEGAVGGYVNSGMENGRLMAKMAHRILAGEAPESLPVVFDTPQALILDFNELKRFGVSVESLPAEAHVLNRPPTIFDPERRATLNGLIAAILFLILVLCGLFMRARMKIMRIRHQRAKELQSANEALMRANTAAEFANHAKSSFLANMSHEIRTPLNAILGLAQVGQRENGKRDTQRLFDQMMDSGNLLLGIINEILDFSKIEAGKLAIEEEPVSLKRLVEHLLVLSETRAREKGLALRVQQGKDLPDWVAGDFLRLTQVLGNLLSNAIKFTEMGGVTLSLNRRGETLVFGVTDTGIGLTEEQIGRLFSAFEQADTSTTRKFGGTGLGLAISKRLVELMGGAITVTSRPEAGSRFEVIVPLREIDAPIDSETRPTGEAKLPHGAGLQRLQGYRILAAEDNPVNQLVLEDMLTLEGASLVCVDDGLQALDLLNDVGEQSFDLVLTDIQMPRMDGHQLAQRLRELYPELPVVGLTAHAMAEERQRCFDNGMVAHVTKPIEMEALIAVVQKHARRAVAPATIPAANIADLPVPTFSFDAVDPEIIDWAALNERFGGRQAFIDKLVATTLANTCDKAEALRAAAAAQDFAAIAFIAHSLKGTGGNMKASRIQLLGSQTEDAAGAAAPETAELARQLAGALDALRAALICRNGTVGVVS